MSLNSLSFTHMSHLPSIHGMTTDGTLMPLAGVGYVVTPHLSLHNVYILPKLTLNFGYIGQVM